MRHSYMVGRCDRPLAMGRARAAQGSIARAAHAVDTGRDRFGGKISSPPMKASSLPVGWHRRLSTPEPSTFAAGRSGWEIGTQRTKIKEKADSDYETLNRSARSRYERHDLRFRHASPMGQNASGPWRRKPRRRKKWRDLRAPWVLSEIGNQSCPRCRAEPRATETVTIGTGARAMWARGKAAAVSRCGSAGRRLGRR